MKGSEAPSDDPFTAALVTVTTTSGRVFRRLFLRRARANAYARGACVLGGSATVELVDVRHRAPTP